MNRDMLEGNWKRIKGKVREQWGRLTNDDLDVIAGREEQLLGAIQRHYGVKREEAKQQLDTWLKALEDKPS